MTTSVDLPDMRLPISEVLKLLARMPTKSGARHELKKLMFGYLYGMYSDDTLVVIPSRFWIPPHE